MDEVDILMEEVKQAIRQKVSRQVFLKNLIESDQVLGRARYLSDNQRGAILSMRRVHKFSVEVQQIEETCNKLLQLRRQLETATLPSGNGSISTEGILALDLGELQDTLEQALDPHAANHTTVNKPSDQELLRQAQRLARMFEI